jgi:RHS repeat-associated protein
VPADGHIYGAYGVRSAASGRARTAYGGEVAEADMGQYLLGSRIYDPVLRRFLNPDALSPFDDGGVNRYAYCNGDPIGRTDPHGRSWLSWMVSTLDRMEFPVTTVAGSSGVESAFATPTVLATAAFRPESAPLWAAVKSRQPNERFMEALRHYGDARVRIATPGAQGTRMFTPEAGIHGVQWPRAGDTGSVTLFMAAKRTIQIVQGPHALSGDRRRASLAARGVVYPKWIERTNARGGVHFATTTSVSPAYIRPLKNYVEARYPGRPVTMLAGAHGTMVGSVWGSDGRRMHLEQRFHDSVKKKLEELDWTLNLVNYADVRSERAARLLSDGEGIYIHFTCFGAVDKLFMEAFDIRDITLRSLSPMPTTSAPTP